MAKKQLDVMMTLEGPPLVEAFAARWAIVQEHVTNEETTFLPHLGARSAGGLEFSGPPPR